MLVKFPVFSSLRTQANIGRQRPERATPSTAEPAPPVQRSATSTAIPLPASSTPTAPANQLANQLAILDKASRTSPSLPERYRNHGYDEAEWGKSKLSSTSKATVQERPGSAAAASAKGREPSEHREDGSRTPVPRRNPP